ncbi:hypothetical protein B0H34DRAFT_671521 [Crassisporium funariophilum]|nr:hypothetical protein B0H34DRAFT_671521 [Crassisporium funariophilum]
MKTNASLGDQRRGSSSVAIAGGVLCVARSEKRSLFGGASYFEDGDGGDVGGRSCKSELTVGDGVRTRQGLDSIVFPDSNGVHGLELMTAALHRSMGEVVARHLEARDWQDVAVRCETGARPSIDPSQPQQLEMVAVAESPRKTWVEAVVRVGHSHRPELTMGRFGMGEVTRKMDVGDAVVLRQRRGTRRATACCRPTAVDHRTQNVPVIRYEIQIEHSSWWFLQIRAHRLARGAPVRTEDAWSPKLEHGVWSAAFGVNRKCRCDGLCGLVQKKPTQIRDVWGWSRPSVTALTLKDGGNGIIKENLVLVAVVGLATAAAVYGVPAGEGIQADLSLRWLLAMYEESLDAKTKHGVAQRVVIGVPWSGAKKPPRLGDAWGWSRLEGGGSPLRDGRRHNLKSLRKRRWDQGKWGSRMAVVGVAIAVAVCGVMQRVVFQTNSSRCRFGLGKATARKDRKSETQVYRMLD